MILHDFIWEFFTMLLKFGIFMFFFVAIVIGFILFLELFKHERKD
jgi:hypothetical protein